MTFFVMIFVTFLKCIESRPCSLTVPGAPRRFAMSVPPLLGIPVLLVEALQKPYTYTRCLLPIITIITNKRLMGIRLR